MRGHESLGAEVLLGFNETFAEQSCPDPIHHDPSGQGVLRVAFAKWLIDPKNPEDDLLEGIASLFNGALFKASTIDAVGVPDLRLFVRGDEVEGHRRLQRSGLKFGTCLTTAYVHPNGAAEFKPILGGRMHTQYPDDATKRYFTYRNRGYLMSQPGMRKLLPQEWIRFGWFFLVTTRNPKGLAEWMRLRRLGRREHFQR